MNTTDWSNEEEHFTAGMDMENCLSQRHEETLCSALNNEFNAVSVMKNRTMISS